MEFDIQKRSVSSQTPKYPYAWTERGCQTGSEIIDVKNVNWLEVPMKIIEGRIRRNIGESCIEKKKKKKKKAYKQNKESQTKKFWKKGTVEDKYVQVNFDKKSMIPEEEIIQEKLEEKKEKEIKKKISLEEYKKRKISDVQEPEKVEFKIPQQIVKTKKRIKILESRLLEIKDRLLMYQLETIDLDHCKTLTEESIKNWTPGEE